MNKRIIGTLAGVSAMCAAFALGAHAASDIRLYVNGNVSPTAIELIDDTSYVPLRAVAEMLGAEVRWDDDTRSVHITSAHSNVQHDGVYEFDGFALSAVSITKDEYGWSITADIRNLGGTDYRTLGLTAAFYDRSGNRIGTATGTVYGLKQGQIKTVIFAAANDLTGYETVKFQADFTS